MKLNWRRLFLGQRDGSPELSAPTTGPAGPHFPESAGDRERGKFRPSKYPRGTMVAVCDDDGAPIGARTEEVLSDISATLKDISATLSAIRADLESD